MQVFTKLRTIKIPTFKLSMLNMRPGAIYYSKFAKDELFDIAYFSPIANDTPVRGPHYCVLNLSICHVQLALIILNSFISIFIFNTNTQK